MIALFAAGALSTMALTAVIAAEYTIVIDKMKFAPVPDSIHPGDTVIWQNNDVLRHSATDRGGSFDLDLPAKASVSMIVEVAGTIDFFCKYHPGMMGTLVVSQP